MDFTFNGVLGSGASLDLNAASAIRSFSGLVTRETTTLALPDLCEVIVKHQLLKEAKINSVELYVEPHILRNHTFLVLELESRYGGLRTFCLWIEGLTQSVSETSDHSVNCRHSISATARSADLNLFIRHSCRY